MSAVQPCLETTDMSNASDLLNSFETVDEDKDSDEESFHLFLEGEGDEDITKENIDEKEDDNTISAPEENNESLDKQKQDSSEITESENKTDKIISSDKDTLVEKQTEPTKEIEAIKENGTEKQSTEDVTSDSNENINISKENISPAEETISKPIVAETETEATSENEDDILNKHVSSDEFGNNVEELDPNIEDSLLNECDDIESEENIEKNSIIEPETDIVMTSEENKREVTDSVVEKQADRTVQHASENSEKCSKIIEASKDSEKNNDSVGNSQKCDDNSNSSSPDTDDLLDISMIKDSAQDDADIAEDALQLEQENDDSSSKCIENVDNVEESSHSDNSDEDGKEESEISETVQNELSDSEKDKEVVENEKEESINKIDETQDQNVVENGENASIVDPDNSQNCDQQATDKTSKRNLSNSDIEPASKRIKLVDTNEDESEMDCGDITELQNLISFSQFMTKSHLKKLTRTDLEEFCIQKLCEAILHKSELGETNHQLKILEQTIESLRRDQTVLTKQIKDLEIVNKKLMHEILAANGTKPILPVKITRSVGLQVRLPSANDPNAAKRRSLPTPPQKTPIVQNQVVAPKGRTPINTPNRPLSQPSPQKTTPILNQALQNRNRTPVKTPQPQSIAPQRPNISPKPVPEKRARTSGSFIDLTDEDDKRANSKVVNNKNLKSIVPQGVRINSVPKTTSVSSVLPSVVSNTQQVMYVVQQNSQLKQGVLTAHGQKAVLVNFQPTNGVLNSLNSSSVSVIPKVTANVPIKAKPSPQNSSLKVAKHPAPLPNPPAVQGPLDKGLKGIPPKPVVSFRKTNTGIILQWRMPYDLSNYEAIASYQVYAYQETSAVPSTDMWRKVGDVKAMALPMACTLAQFPDKNKYYFAVRPVDVHKRIGKFSHPVLSE